MEDYFDEHSENSSQDANGVVVEDDDDGGVVVVESVEAPKGETVLVEVNDDADVAPYMSGTTTARQAPAPTAPKGIQYNNDYVKAARKLLTGESVDDDDTSDSSSTSDSSTQEENYDGYIRTSVPLAVAGEEGAATAEQDATLASPEQIEQLRKLYTENKEMLETLQKKETAYGHTYSQSQLDATFKYYLSQDGEGVQNGITVFQFVHSFFDSAITELKLAKKIKESQANILELKTKSKTLKTQRLLSEGYDQSIGVKVAIQERGNEDVETIKREGKANVLRGDNWGTIIPPTDISNPNWLKQGVSKIIVDNPVKMNGGMHGYLVYRILIFTKAGKIIMVQRRFNNLKKLYKDLKSEVHCSLPKMPSEKHWLLGGNNPNYVLKRIEEIRQFLDRLTQTRDVIDSQSLREFCLTNAQWRDATEGY